LAIRGIFLLGDALSSVAAVALLARLILIEVDPVEEVDDASFKGIFRADHHQAFVLDQVFKDLRAMPELV
jgi:hypothetical protein